MTKLQKLQLEQSEKREKLNALNALDKLTLEQRAELQPLVDRLTELEPELRAAIAAEPDPDDKTKKTEPKDEEKEVRKLQQRARLQPFVREALEYKPVDGAEAELRAAVMPGAGEGIPFELLLTPEQRAALWDQPKAEERAVTPVADSAKSDGSRSAVLERVFTRSVAARLGVSFDTVETGASVYPVMLTGTTASAQAASGEQAAVAGSFEGHSLSPRRISGSYEYQIEDSATMPDLEATLQRDLAAVLTDALDDQVVNGDGTAPNFTGFLAELEAADDPTAVTAWDDILEVFAGEVDGLNAYELTDLRAIVGPASFRYLATLFAPVASVTHPQQSSLDYTRERTGGLSASSRIPVPASSIQTGIMALTSYPGRNAVLPVWNTGGFSLIRDPYTQAKKGVVGLTAQMLANFKVLREAGWSLFKIRTA